MTTETIWLQFRKDLLAFIRSKVKNGDVAKDLLQEVFIKVHLHLSNLKDEQKLEKWLYQITRNVISDHFRSLKPVYLNQEVAADVFMPRETDPRKFSECMLPLVKQLPEKYRLALELSDLQNISQKRLSGMLGVSYSAAKSRVQRARFMLKSLLEKCCTIQSDRYGNIVSHVPRGNCLCSSF